MGTVLGEQGTSSLAGIEESKKAGLACLLSRTVWQLGKEVDGTLAAHYVVTAQRRQRIDQSGAVACKAINLRKQMQTSWPHERVALCYRTGHRHVMHRERP